MNNFFEWLQGGFGCLLLIAIVVSLFIVTAYAQQSLMGLIIFWAIALPLAKWISDKSG